MEAPERKSDDITSRPIDDGVAPRQTVRPKPPTPDSPARARALAQELREVHARLRAALDLAIEQSDDDAGDPTQDPLLYCWGFCAALDGHHRSEDDALFPVLVREHPELAPVVEQLMHDHRMIEHLIGSLRHAIGSGADAAARRQHLDGIAAIMESHFRFEERHVLPVLDGLDPDDVPSPTALYGPLA